MADQVIIEFKADVEDLRAEINKIKSQLGGLNQDASSIGDGVSTGVNKAKGPLASFGNSFKNLGGIIKNVAGPLLAAFAIQDIVRTAVTSVKEFEVALDQLSSLTGLDQNSQSFQELTDRAKNLANETTLTAAEVVDAYKLIGSQQPALLENADALAKVTEQAVTLSQAGTIPLEQAASALTGTLNQFGLGADEANRVINALAAGSQKGAADVNALSETFKNAGTALSANNVSVEQSIGLAETLAEKQISGAEAGTALRNVTLRLANAGKGFVDGQFDIEAALSQVNSEFNAIQDPVKRTQELTKLFGVESSSAGQILLDNIDTFKDYTSAVTDTNTAQVQAAINTDNLETSIGKLTSKYNDLFLQLDTGEGPIADTAKLLVDVLNFALDVVGEGFAQVGDIFTELGVVFDDAKSIISEVVSAFLDLSGQSEVNISLLDVFKKVIEAALIPVRFFVIALKGIVDQGKTVLEFFKEIIQNGLSLQSVFDLVKNIITDVAVRFARFGKVIAEFLNIDTAKLDSFIATNERFKKTLDDSTKSTEDLSKETQGAADAIDNLGGSAEGASPKVKTLSESIKDEVSELRKILENQALTGSLDQAVVDRLSQLELQQRAATALIKEALDPTNFEFDPSEVLSDVGGLDLDIPTVKAEIEFEPNFEDIEPDQAAIDASEKLLNEKIARDQQAADNQKALQKELTDFAINEGLALADQLFEIQQAKIDREIELVTQQEERKRDELQRSLDAGLISEKQFEERKIKLQEESDRKRRELQLKQAKADKAKALFDIAVATAIAVTAGLASPAIPPFPSAIAAGIAGAAQAAIVAATPLPVFEKGGVVGGKRHSQGGTLIEAERGEFVVNRRDAIKNKSALEALNSGKFDKYIYSNHVMPALEAITRKSVEEGQRRLSDSITSNFVSNDFNDMNILNSDKKTRQILLQIRDSLNKTGTEPYQR